MAVRARRVSGHPRRQQPGLASGSSRRSRSPAHRQGARRPGRGIVRASGGRSGTAPAHRRRQPPDGRARAARGTTPRSLPARGGGRRHHGRRQRRRSVPDLLPAVSSGGLATHRLHRRLPGGKAVGAVQAAIIDVRGHLPAPCPASGTARQRSGAGPPALGNHPGKRQPHPRRGPRHPARRYRLAGGDLQPGQRLFRLRGERGRVRRPVLRGRPHPLRPAYAGLSRRAKRAAERGPDAHRWRRRLSQGKPFRAAQPSLLAGRRPGPHLVAELAPAGHLPPWRRGQRPLLVLAFCRRTARGPAPAPTAAADSAQRQPGHAGGR